MKLNFVTSYDFVMLVRRLLIEMTMLHAKWLQRIWSWTYLIPGLPFPHFLPPGQTIPIKLIPLDKWSPTNSNLMDKWSLKIWTLYFRIPKACTPGQLEYSRDHLSRGTKLVGDHLSMATKFFGTLCPWWPNWLGPVVTEGTINWGPIVGDQMSGDHMRLGPNVLVLHRPVSNKTSDIPAPMLCNENLSALANLIFCRRVIEMAVYNSVVLQKWDH